MKGCTYEDGLGTSEVEGELLREDLRRDERSDGLDSLVVELNNRLLDSDGV
jgi:hypothetical protein